MKSDIQLGNMDMAVYLNEIRRLEDCTVLIAVRDVHGFCITEDIIDGLKSLGFDQADILRDQEYHSFIGIWTSGKVVYQNVGGDEMISHGQYLNNHYLYLKSATWSSGNVAEVYIDHIAYAVNNRGFNIVTMDNVQDTFIDSVVYDTHAEDIPLYRLTDGDKTFIQSTRR
ncbi:hypothetical protein D3Z36_05165 [Lachnospiraceae bacterium]|nr:hypothetical protein [Lachnospiraceae bacterium]